MWPHLPVRQAMASRQHAPLVHRAPAVLLQGTALNPQPYITDLPKDGFVPMGVVLQLLEDTKVVPPGVCMCVCARASLVTGRRIAADGDCFSLTV